MSTRPQIPQTPEEWYRSADSVHQKDKLMQGLRASEWSSASKMTFEQFLLLRAYWQPTRGVDQFHLDKIVGVKVAQESKQLIENEPHGYFGAYFSTLNAPPQSRARCAPISSGPFALVLHQQDQVSDKEVPPGDGNAKVIISPRYFLRSDAAAAAREAAVAVSPTPVGQGGASQDQLTASLANMKLSKQSTPPESRSIQNLQFETPPDKVFDEEAAFTGSIPESGESRLSAFSQFSPEQVQAASDEQIVNAALVSFLQATTMYWCSTLGWSLHRNILKMSDLYEARTDGCLCVPGKPEQPLAILETKAHVRKANETQIKIQEAAQMAAWIRQQGPGDLVSRNKQPSNMHRRLLISQDSREVYITIGEYDDKYEMYLKNTSDQSKDIFTALPTSNFDYTKLGPFLKMTCYGPFDIQSAKHMKLLANAAVAFTKTLQP